MGLLPSDDRVARGASGETEPGEESMQVLEGVSRHLRGPEDHAGASHRIEHPGRNGDHGAGGRLDVDQLTGSAALVVACANGLTEQGMPRVVDDRIPPDMGRMNR
jgi:hypothetical protein